MAKGTKNGGRTKGTPNRVTQASRERIEADGDPIGFLLDVMNGKPIEAALTKEPGAAIVELTPTLDQRQSAATTLARKMLPDAKDSPITFAMPKVETAVDATKSIGAVLAAVAEGQITPSEGQILANIVEGFRKAIETHEIEKRLTALERKK